jgi:hypothetical protein
MADPQKLNEWLGREAGEPVHVATDTSDLTTELKQGLSFVRKESRGRFEAMSRVLIAFTIMCSRPCEWLCNFYWFASARYAYFVLYRGVGFLRQDHSR